MLPSRRRVVEPGLVQSTSRPQPGLTPAERARTLVASAPVLRLGVLNLTHDVTRHAVASDGSLLLLAPPDSPAGVSAVAPRLPSPTVTVLATDVSGVPLADRIRGRLVLTGTLTPAVEPLPGGVRRHLVGPDPRDHETLGPVLRLNPVRVGLEWLGERVEVALEEYREAYPDPLMTHEHEWLPHLDRDHRELLLDLARRGRPEMPAPEQARALVLDRYGMTLRATGAGEQWDVRLSFARPAVCGCEVRAVFGAMVDRLRGTD